MKSKLRRKKICKLNRFLSLTETFDKLLEKKKFFRKLFKWICNHLFMPEEEKRKGVLNKAMMMYGDTGVGKTTFIKKIVEPYFKTGSLFLNLAH